MSIRTLIVEVEVDDQELESHNAKRLATGRQTQNAYTVIENQVTDALQSKLFPKVTCRAPKLASMRHSKDAYANG